MLTLLSLLLLPPSLALLSDGDADCGETEKARRGGDSSSGSSTSAFATRLDDERGTSLRREYRSGDGEEERGVVRLSSSGEAAADEGAAEGGGEGNDSSSTRAFRCSSFPLSCINSCSGLECVCLVSLEYGSCIASCSCCEWEGRRRLIR